MKHLLKKLQRGSGGGHDVGRSSGDSAVPSSSGQQSSGLDPRATSRNNAVEIRANGDEDFSSLEEEFQVQLALAISASSSTQKNDPEESRQIKAAERLSLECSSSCGVSSDLTAETLSRRYWDYNVLDYEEKILDGFYDVYSNSSELNFHGPLPSLDELQQLPVSANLDYEVVLVNRVLDPALEQLREIAQCVALECGAASMGPVKSGLIQKIADIVANQMGGPVSDANDMLARWAITSHQLRLNSNNVVLPLGCLQIGLSRHRALLFKVLADHVGIPCRLVKGSHYTGIDGGAVNIIKLDLEKEFIIDLMGAPGTLIPGEIPHIVSAQIEEVKSMNSGQEASSHLEKDLLSSLNTGIGKAMEVRPAKENKYHAQNSTVDTEFDPTASASVMITGTSSHMNAGEKKNLIPNKLPEIRNNEFRRRRENISSGPGRPPNPMAQKNPFISNDIVGEDDLIDGLRTKKATEKKGFNAPLFADSYISRANPALQSNQSSSKSAAADANALDGLAHNIALKGLPDGEAPFVSALSPSMLSDSCMNNSTSVKADNLKASGFENKKESNANDLFGQNLVNRERPYNNVIEERRDYNKNIYVQRKPQQCTNVSSGRGSGYDNAKRPGNLSVIGSSRLDTVMDDVAEWEIPWEDLVIGERIGLGSYGEVYRAEWNGTEVAVKKFLDQDFSGDAIQEFRSEVRIMRRLRHPNVVLFMGAVTRPPNLSIVTEFLPRGSLYRLIHRPNVQIDEKRRIRMALDVAKGMNCLHSSSPTIVHRDLKSPNLLVDKNWAVKVCDFGLSRMKQNTFLSSKSTAGTPEWMAPEVLRNELSNEKCDVYSFGVILWELATLRMPWSGMNPMQVVGAVGFQNRRLDVPKEVDPLVARIIRECWQTDPNLRPSFSQLMVALKPLKRLVIPSSTDIQCSVASQEQIVNPGQAP